MQWILAILTLSEPQMIDTSDPYMLSGFVTL